VPESGPLGSGRGARGNLRPYRETLDDASKRLDVAKTKVRTSPWDKSIGRLVTG
jgi:hypothetical protein